ncbi:MAG: hypothetical protein HOM58_22360 [Rhodospirillaceae bacterium]|jgi:hypothetical protein|nr:hypothetical protein [Rhodospirillaceae bacterium]MBT5457401.1 hypothetical protein [Rhodospirillaceae bacterium]
MSLADSLPMFSDTLLTGLVWFLLLSVVLYLTRAPAHRAIVTLCRVLNEAMQLASGSILGAEKRLAERNRDVLLAVGREASQRGIEREFERVEVNVQREIAQCTAIDRLMNESLTKIEEDHKQSMEVPPAPPGWAGVVQAIAEVPGKSDPIVSGILEQIHTSLVKMQEQAINAYRSATQERHAHLKKMAPEWRSLGQLAAQMKKNVTTMIERSQTIDHKMDEYENIVRKSEQAERTLTASSLSQFFVSGLVLAIAIGGAFINFQLIARPMAEAVGANSFVGDLKIAEIAALVIILLETAMGLFLMESFRITRLFPMIGALPDKTRQRMIYVTLSILFFFACVESGLAYMRELLLEDELATSAVLRGGAAAAATNSYMWITTTAQMVMGFVLPFALVFVAIPLESFIESSRTVIGVALAALLRAMAAFCRVLSRAFEFTGRLLVDVYDIAIFGPLWLEAQVKSVKFARSARSARSDGAPLLRQDPADTRTVNEVAS